MNTLKDTLNDIKWWVRNSSPLYINLNLYRCYDVWRPWKKYFIKPVWKFQYVIRSWFTLFRLESEGLWWKLKYDEPRHEEDPCIKLSFLYWTWKWSLVSPNEDSPGSIDSLIYWETLLWMRKLDKKFDNKAQALYTAISYNTWSAPNREKENACGALTPLGKQMYISWSHHVSTETDNQA